MSVRWNVHKIVNEFCGFANPEAQTLKRRIQFFCKRVNAVTDTPIKPKAVYKWIERGSIPGDRILDISKVAAKREKMFRPILYMQDVDTSSASVASIDIFS